MTILCVLIVITIALLMVFAWGFAMNTSAQLATSISVAKGTEGECGPKIFETDTVRYAVYDKFSSSYANQAVLLLWIAMTLVTVIGFGLMLTISERLLHKMVPEGSWWPNTFPATSAIVLAFLMVPFGMFTYGLYNPSNQQDSSLVKYGFQIQSAEARLLPSIALVIGVAALWLAFGVWFQEPWLMYLVALYLAIAIPLIRINTYPAAISSSLAAYKTALDKLNTDVGRDMTSTLSTPATANVPLAVAYVKKNIVRVELNPDGTPKDTHPTDANIATVYADTLWKYVEHMDGSEPRFLGDVVRADMKSLRNMDGPIGDLAAGYTAAVNSVTGFVVILCALLAFHVAYNKWVDNVWLWILVMFVILLGTGMYAWVSGQVYGT